MKNNKVLSQEMKTMSVDQLRLAVDDVRRELFQLRLKSKTGHVKSFSSDKQKLEVVIARGLTYLHQKTQEKTQA